MAYGIPVGERINMERWQAVRTHRLLRVFEKFGFFRNATMSDYRNLSDNQLYYRVTIWEDLDVNY